MLKNALARSCSALIFVVLIFGLLLVSAADAHAAPAIIWYFGITSVLGKLAISLAVYAITTVVSKSKFGGTRRG